MVVISYDLAILFLIVVILIRASKLRAMMTRHRIQCELGFTGWWAFAVAALLLVFGGGLFVARMIDRHKSRGGPARRTANDPKNRHLESADSALAAAAGSSHWSPRSPRR